MSRVIREVIAEIKAKTDQFDAQLARVEGELQKTKRGAEGFGTAIGTTGQRSAEAARQIASATETVARAGKVTGEAGKQIVAQASNIAFAFGPQGAAIGALAIFGIAVATMFSKAKEEARQAREEFDRTFNALRGQNNYDATGRRLAQLYAGDPTFESPDARTQEAFRVGFGELRNRVTRARTALDDAISSGLQSRITAARNELNAVLEQSNLVYAQVQRTQALFNEQAALNTTRLANLKKLADDERASDEARAAAKRELAEAEREAERAAEAARRASEQFTTDFNALVLRELGTATDQIAQSFDALIAKGREVGASAFDLDLLETLKAQALEAAAALERTDALLRDLDLAAAEGVAPTADTFAELNAEIARVEAELAQLAQGTRAYEAVFDRLINLRRRQKGLLAGVTDAGGGSAAPADRGTATIARDLQQAVDGALQLAQAFGAVESSVVGVLRAVSQIAGNLPRLAQALASGDAFGVVSSSVAMLGSLASLAGPSPVEQQRRQEIRANTEALKALSKQLGLVGSAAVTGDASVRSRQQLAAFLATFLATPLNGFNARTGAQQFGLDLRELDQVAAEFGITLNGSVESFRQLQRALTDTITKLGEFGTDLESARREADAAARVFGITDPQELLGLTTRTLAGRSPVLDRALAGLDLSTAEGRAAARQALQGIFSLMQAGGGQLSDGDLGGLTGDQLLQAILDLIDRLNAVDESLGTNVSTVSKPDRIVTADATQITADQASRLLGVTTTMAGDVRRIREAIDALQAPLTLPALWDGAGGSPGHGAVTIQITQEFHGPATPSAVAQATREAMAEAVDLMLGRRLLMQRRHTGKAVTA